MIRAERLSKSYKLYDSSRARLFDILGFRGIARNGTRLHHALHDLTFEIRRGERVAIIGRNGAGKSTLLKLIAHVINPTSGVLDVSGQTCALLSIGAGFHPEFTGRQNVAAYLAHLGFNGAGLSDLVERAIAFSEIEDYADQPLKTYSTGMAMRIMFAAATMVRPELFVIDEVLAVGDAYFQQKSFKHISEICAAGETTLLLVTHDIYSASQLCDRMLWLDRGRLLIDGPPQTVMRAYQDSIREQEERRLRAKALAARADATRRRILIDIQSDGNRPPEAPLHIALIALTIGGVQIATAPMTDLAFGGDGTAYLVAEGSNWGEPQWVDGRLARSLRPYGSPFHKVTAAFHADLEVRDLDRLGVRVVAYTMAPGAFTVRVHAESFERTLGRLVLEPGRWSETILACAGDVPPAPAHAPVEEAPAADLRMPETADEVRAPAAVENTGGVRTRSPSVNIEGRYGSGDVEIVALRALDEDGVERHVFPAALPLSLLLDYRLRRPGLREKLTIVLAFKRDGVTDVARLFCDHLEFDAAQRPAGTVRIDLDPCPLGVGRYSVTVMIAREGYFRERQTLFFTVNPAVYDVRVGVLDIDIEDTSQVHAGTGAVIEARWSIHQGDGR
ncbi:MAG: hypothetical protein OHK0044_09920 [Burkholderiaceae bacterium]